MLIKSNEIWKQKSKKIFHFSKRNFQNKKKTKVSNCSSSGILYSDTPRLTFCLTFQTNFNLFLVWGWFSQKQTFLWNNALEIIVSCIWWSCENFQVETHLKPLGLRILWNIPKDKKLSIISFALIWRGPHF